MVPIQKACHTPSYREHETKCEYAPVPCPNSSLCPFVLAKVGWSLCQVPVAM